MPGRGQNLNVTSSHNFYKSLFIPKYTVFCNKNQRTDIKWLARLVNKKASFRGVMRVRKNKRPLPQNVLPFNMPTTLYSGIVQPNFAFPSAPAPAARKTISNLGNILSVMVGPPLPSMPFTAT
jgi:hypothetical protein